GSRSARREGFVRRRRQRRDPATGRRSAAGMLRRGSWPAAGPESYGHARWISPASAEAAARGPSGDPAATRPRRPRDATRRAPPAMAPQIPACRKTRPSPLSGFPQLLDLSDNHFALDASEPIDEDHAVQVIHLVLKRACQEVLPLDRLFDALPRHASDDRALRPDDGGVEAGRAETAFLFELCAFT